MLQVDALAGGAPELAAILTTRTATVDMAAFYEALRFVVRALRRRWPATEYASLLEFTTGYGPRSGGARRPHWNLLLKGIPAQDVAEARAVIARTWARNVDARAEVQYVAVLETARAFMRYVAQHFQKESQAPPRGFKGQRFNCSRGYFVGRTRRQARDEARAALRLKRELWKALAAGLGAHDAELVAQIEVARARRWELVTWLPGERPQAPVRQAAKARARMHGGRPPDTEPERPGAGGRRTSARAGRLAGRWPLARTPARPGSALRSRAVGRLDWERAKQRERGRRGDPIGSDRTPRRRRARDKAPVEGSVLDGFDVTARDERGRPTAWSRGRRV